MSLAAVEGGVLVGNFEGGGGTVDARDARAARDEVEGEAALIAEDVEGVAVGVGGGRGVVLALVEEGSGFLPGKGIVVELDSVHGNDGRVFITLQQCGFAGRESFQ